MEHKLLAAMIADRTGFDRIDSHLSEKEFSPEGAIILRNLREFYNRDLSARKADLEVVKQAVLNGLNNNKHQQLFELYFQKLGVEDVSAVNVIEAALTNKRRALEASLIEAIGNMDTKSADSLMNDMLSLSTAFEKEEGVEEYSGMSIKDLASDLDPENCIRLYPKSLDRRAKGRTMRGHHIVIVAYPEVGKTAVSTTLLCGFLIQNLKVLYVGNEDPIKSVITRAVACLTGMTTEAVTSNPERAEEIAKPRGYDNAVFVGLPDGTTQDLTALCEKHRPDVLIVDQIRNIVSNSENRTMELEKVARHMRRLAKRYNLLAVSVTQGADSARDKLFLDMGDVDSSNVGIPGTADMMVMIGMNKEYDNNNWRMITTAKNKIGGVHESWPVCINKPRSRIYDASDGER